MLHKTNATALLSNMKHGNTSPFKYFIKETLKIIARKVF